MTSSGRMLPSEALEVEVGVCPDPADGTWWPGYLEPRRRNSEGDSEGFVRYSTGPGQNRIGWFGYDVLREA